MTVSMGIKDLRSGEHHVVPIGPAASFRTTWVPLCRKLRLELLPICDSGAFCPATEAEKSQILQELARLHRHVDALQRPTPGELEVKQRVQRLIDALRPCTSADFEVDFG